MATIARRPVELVPSVEADLGDTENRRKREAAFSAVQSIAPVPPGNRVRAGVLGPGDYRGDTLAFPARIDGLGWPQVTGVVTFQGAGHIVRGIVFTVGVNLSATANVEFADCVFLAPIVVLAGGRIGCSACRFDGTAAIANAGVPGDANRVGCVGSSALVADANVTIGFGV